MQMLSSQLIDSISNLHEVFSSHIFIATCRGFWDKMGQVKKLLLFDCLRLCFFLIQYTSYQVVLRFLEGRKENRVWYNGSYYALGVSTYLLGLEVTYAPKGFYAKKIIHDKRKKKLCYSLHLFPLQILDDTFASQMQRLQGNSLQDKDLEPPRSIIEARSILCRDTTNATDSSTYLYIQSYSLLPLCCNSIRVQRYDKQTFHCHLFKLVYSF